MQTKNSNKLIKMKKLNSKITLLIFLSIIKDLQLFLQIKYQLLNQILKKEKSSMQIQTKNLKSNKFHNKNRKNYKAIQMQMLI